MKLISRQQRQIVKVVSDVAGGEGDYQDCQQLLQTRAENADESVTTCLAVDLRVRQTQCSSLLHCLSQPLKW